MTEPEGISPTDRVVEAQMKGEAAHMRQAYARQIVSKEAYTQSVEDAFNPFSADKDIEFKALKHRPLEVPEEEREFEAMKVTQKRDPEEYAQERQERNPELDARQLVELRRLILAKEGATAEETLADIKAYFDDPSLAEEAMEYLIETTDGKTAELIKEARDLLHARQGRETRAGRNMGPESRAYAEQGLESAGMLRDLYRDITGKQQTDYELFKTLSAQFPFDRLKMVIKFLFESLGSDLRSKGPSIPRGELYALLTEARALQAILGLYEFFKKRERLIRKLFAQNGIPVPEELEFELLAQQFMDLVEERYPTSMRIYRIAAELGIDEDILAQIIVFGQYRDAVREIAPRIYRNLQHRYDLLQALIEALEELEDTLDEELEGVEDDDEV